MQKLEIAVPSVTVTRVTRSDYAEIYEVEIEEDNAVLHVSADGSHLFAGDMYVLSDEGIINVTEIGREENRARLLSRVSMDDMIVFAPTNGTREILYVFTDVDCTYCRMLHQDVEELNRYGMEIRYLAYPRIGESSPAYERMVSAWCADDPQTALTELKSGDSIATTTCDDPVLDQFELGRMVGVGGTPTLITSRGKRIRGCLPPEEMAERVRLLSDRSGLAADRR